MKKLPLVVCWWRAKEYPQLPERLVKHFFCLLHLYEATVLKYTSTELQVTRAEMRIQLSSISQTVKIFTNVQNNATLLTNFFYFGKVLFSLRNVI